MPLRKVWSDALGIELKNTDVVCELHFNYEDLHMNDDFTLINGELFVSVRERITLKRKARPVGIVVEAVSIKMINIINGFYHYYC